MPVAARRWDTDERGIGVADALAWRTTVGALADLAESDGWIAEDPELHLLPNVRAATSSAPFTIARTTVDPDGTFVVDLDWAGAVGASRREVRQALFGLVGAIAETVTLLRETVLEGGSQIEVLTGVVGEESPFASHGHTVRVRVDLQPAAGQAS